MWMILAIPKAYEALAGTGWMDHTAAVLHLQHILQSLIGFLVMGKSDIDMTFSPFLFHLLLTQT